MTDDQRKSLHAADCHGSQQCIEIGKLSALTFVAHPKLFLRIPLARPMKKEKCATLVSRVFFV